MGLNYGIRGGDVIDLFQINNYIKSLEIMANMNVVLNTKFFENNVDEQISSIFFLPLSRRISVASIYILKGASVSAPTTYPSIPTVINIQTNANLTETNVATNTQSFNTSYNGVDYTVCILRRTITVSTTDIYVQCKFAPISSVKILGATGLSQFVVWTEPEASIIFDRLIDGDLSSYNDFGQLFRLPDFSSYSSCLLDDSSEVLIVTKNDSTFRVSRTTPISSFFMCDNFTDSYLRKLRFIFPNTTTFDKFRIIRLHQTNPDFRHYTYFEVDLKLENNYTSYDEYSINDVADFRKNLKSIQKPNNNNLISIAGCYQNVDDFTVDVISRCVKTSNKPYSDIPLLSQYALSPATFFPLRNNTNTPHISVNFQGNIGDGEKSYINSNTSNNLRLSFENGLVDVFTNEFTYVLNSSYEVLFGIGL